MASRSASIVHHLLSVSLSPCCRFHPAEMGCRIGQISASHAAFTLRLLARPSDLLIFEATFTFTVVTARRLVISPRETLSMDFRTARILDTPAILPSELQGS